MSNDIADEQQAEQPAPMPLDRVALAAALARLFSEEIGPAIDERMSAPVERLIEAYEKSGQPGVVARIGDRVAGKYTVNVTHPKYTVEDGKALDDYAATHEGLEVILRRNPTWEKALLKHVAQTDSGEIVDTRTGEVVPGLKYVPGGRPNGQITFTWADGGAGRKALMQAWQRGELNDLLDELPMLMPAPTASS
ncbi:hypothetical protein ACGFYQ_33665 [Streptomyces sp. NPDC048258]|uniref:hypothetical protein n=1 Tax=Streptomyces sp. NPDC048258 TaxID=3365527 RepID=UPI0037106BDC